MQTVSNRAAQSGAGVRIYTLGRFRVDVGSSPLQFETRGQNKPLELLKVLVALGAENVPVQRLSDALWPDADGDAARQSFASTLHRLRKLIGNDALSLRNHALTLVPAVGWVDAFTFADGVERLLSPENGDQPERVMTEVEELLTLYRGPFLDGEFEPGEIPSARERLHATFLRTIRRAAQVCIDFGDLARAAEIYRRGLEVDELAEEFHQALMRLHLDQGHIAEGIAVYQRCRDILQAAMDVQPSAETERLYRKLSSARQADSSLSPPEEGRTQATQPVNRSEAESFRKWRRPVLTAAALLLAVALAAGGYRIATQSRTPATDNARDTARAAASLPLPAEPSIVVLPFDNLTGDPEQDYFSEGLTDSLITQLYKIPDLFVIARQSARHYRDRNATVQEIGREAGVRYVLEGSVQRSDQDVRINAQLIEASTGRHLWAEQYDLTLGDVFQAQDELVRRIATELGVQVGYGEMFRTASGATRNYRAFDLYMRADQFFSRHEKVANLKARELLLEAYAEDPKFARVLAFIGWTHMVDYVFQWSEDPTKSFQLAEQWAHRALALDETVYLGHTLMGRILMWKGRHEEAVAESQLALHYEPGNAVGRFSHSLQLIYAGRPQEALPMIDSAMRLAPYPPVYFHFAAGYARALTGRHQEAAAAFRAYLKRQASGATAFRTRCWLIASLMELGMELEARKEVTQLLHTEPTLTISKYEGLMRRQPFKDISFLDRQIELLRKAGLPE